MLPWNLGYRSLTLQIYIAEISVSGAIFLPLIAWVYFHSVLYSKPKKQLYRASGALRSFNVKGNQAGTNQKPICDLLLVFHCYYVPIFYHYWVTTIYWSKILFFLPFYIFQSCFPHKGNSLGPKVWKIGSRNKIPWGTHWWKLHDRMVISFESIPACDRWTDGHAYVVTNTKQHVPVHSILPTNITKWNEKDIFETVSATKHTFTFQHLSLALQTVLADCLALHI